MEIILGFGSTEEDQRDCVYNWVFDTLKKRYLERESKDLDWFDGETIKLFKQDLENYQRQIQEAYDKAESSSPRPQRYYHISFGSRIAFDMDTAFIKIEFWHINSQHPLSPDGMSLMEYTETFTISTEQFEE